MEILYDSVNREWQKQKRPPVRAAFFISSLSSSMHSRGKQLLTFICILPSAHFRLYHYLCIIISCFFIIKIIDQHCMHEYLYIETDAYIIANLLQRYTSVVHRSEERRVGKKSRSRWWREQ